MADGAPAQGSPGSDILERLLGDTGEPDRVAESARALGERTLKPLRAAFADGTSQPVEVDLGAVDTGRMKDAISDAGPYDAVVVAASANSPDALVIRVDPMAIAIFLDALFGGEPGAEPQPITRNLSSLELDIATLVIQQVAAAFNGFGQRTLQVRFPLSPAQSGEALRKIALRDGPAVKITFTVSERAEPGRVVVVMPQRILLRPRDGAEAVESPAGNSRSDDWSARFSEEVMRSRVTLEATMPLGKLTLGAIAALQTGQVIELSPTAASEAKLSSKNKTLFVCEFGRLGQNYTVRIKCPWDTEGNVIDGLQLP
ncbi:flagellar motor switch protein FliM [Nitratireductor mangrovi]|uniref:Flagellar motor switch protein FliM n=1 Tax=Nitratireductor mangrovi TaxID=2599600 RepID=A0A5B8L4L4_9HYPH|nr:FliM/FliN family flagellar motor switch protein [Nitratireductor mangrovi]QDZ02693.2 flagellar motor switch protein FliM [Nitratireductor mangrovi]